MKYLQKFQVTDAVFFIALGTVHFYDYLVYGMTSWLLGNVYTAKSCKGEKRVPDALKSGLVS